MGTTQGKPTTVVMRVDFTRRNKERDVVENATQGRGGYGDSYGAQALGVCVCVSHSLSLSVHQLEMELVLWYRGLVDWAK